MTDMPHENRIKAVLQGMRRAERHKAGRLANTSDMLSLIDGASYGAPEDAQRALDWLARDGTLGYLNENDLSNIGETICIVWNGCGGDFPTMAQWLTTIQLTGDRTALQALREGDSPDLLAAARAAFIAA
ncbi:hypothetical protein [Xanthomonas sp. MUS 060]|uniref:hypothetical protein n=1 Tax=Xanthomonas sp. MUS 060 TaxID=1588031 RepID=UPI0005F2E089|nr:hypothetical protein [Xanthomonas sp. MUS 060]